MTRRFAIEEILEAARLVQSRWAHHKLGMIISDDRTILQDELRKTLESLPASEEFEREVWMLMTPNNPDGSGGFYPECDSENNPILRLLSDESEAIQWHKKVPYTVTYREGHNGL